MHETNLEQRLRRQSETVTFEEAKGSLWILVTPHSCSTQVLNKLPSFIKHVLLIMCAYFYQLTLTTCHHNYAFRPIFSDLSSFKVLTQRRQRWDVEGDPGFGIIDFCEAKLKGNYQKWLHILSFDKEEKHRHWWWCPGKQTWTIKEKEDFAIWRNLL